MRVISEPSMMRDKEEGGELVALTTLSEPGDGGTWSPPHAQIPVACVLV